MAKKDKKKKDPEKKAAVQAKKEAKAQKSALKRLQKSKKDDDFDAALAEHVDSPPSDVVLELEDREPPSPRAHGSFCMEDGDLYLFGGEYYDGSSQNVFGELLRYRISDKKWSRLPDGPPPRCAHSAVSYRGSLYIFGGEFASAGIFHHYRDLWRYDISSKEWTMIPFKTGPSARSGHRCVVWRNLMVLWGGFHDSSETRWHDDLWWLELSCQKWHKLELSRLATAPDARSAACLSVWKDVLYLYGGFSRLSGTTEETRVHGDLWSFPLKALLGETPAKWTRLRKQGSSINPARSGMGCSQYKHRMVLFGGVVDTEAQGHKLESVFYDTLHTFHMEKSTWFTMNLKNRKEKKSKKSKKSEKKNERHESDGNENDDDIKDPLPAPNSNDHNNEPDEDADEDEDDDNEDSSYVNNAGWDLDKLRSNMFVFMDGEGNVVHEKLAHDKLLSESNANEDNVKKIKALSSNDTVLQIDDTGRPTAVLSDKPLPRIHPGAVVVGHSLYLYGGLLEIADREVTLDDLWEIDLRTRETWTCLNPGTMHTQQWKGIDSDIDDASYELSDDINRLNDEDDDPNSRDDPEMATLLAKLQTTTTDSDLLPTPKVGESMAEFYSRTSEVWMQHLNSSDKTQKELKRESFALAQSRYAELRPTLERLHELSGSRRQQTENSSGKPPPHAKSSNDHTKNRRR